ncbi:MAG: T9SS type A sorting domain-containing protein [bacterium]|nr:MAG: T9SS type A sorting domain-containing protein [bacterium]
MKRLIIVLSLISLISFTGGISSIHAQNFVALGSEQALIKYIKGSGSNIGLYVGVEYKPSGLSLQKGETGEMGVVRMFRMGNGGGNVLTGAGQGFGKAVIHQPTAPTSTKKDIHKLIHDGRVMFKIKNNKNMIHKVMTNGEEDFQLMPVYDYKLEKGAVSEILLPVLCLDQDLPVPPGDPDPNFTTSTMSDTVQQAYVGIYRCDKYINENIISKIWFIDDYFAWYEGTLTEAEIIMILFCHIEVDSNSFSQPPEGYYDIIHAHLLPIWAQWQIWAASHNQDTDSFLEGYNYILELQGYPPVPADSILDLYYLNHVVFAMAEMNEFKDRFPAPEGSSSLQIPNLEPYSFIQTNKELFEQQNNADGIEFSAKYSFDADGEIEAFQWEFHGGSIIDSQAIKIKYKNQIADSTPVILLVVDDTGNESRDTVFVPYSEGVVTKIQMDDNRIEIPLKFELKQNYPNPMYTSTMISFKLNTPEIIEIQIFNLLGQKVRTIIHDKFMPGNHKLTWDGKDKYNKDVPAGIYLYQIRSGDLVHTRKLVVIR